MSAAEFGAARHLVDPVGADRTGADNLQLKLLRSRCYGGSLTCYI